MPTKRDGAGPYPPRVSLPDDEATRFALDNFRAAVRRQLVKRGVPEDASDMDKRVDAILMKDTPLRLDVVAILAGRE